MDSLGALQCRLTGVSRLSGISRGPNYNAPMALVELLDRPEKTEAAENE